ncbi:hypothetical protein N1851_000058 [Merluccius polli]|uniref:CCHC-type domain-containing protein n=1 Tax=Merluccius polli TaxID=89951 RepID=A0AA47NCN9_MERPO|nr:hypothetical protein N1851_000058 [Merluccius polli]
MSVVEQFIQSPSDVLLDMCTKEQLVQVADHYSVSLTSEDKRLKETLLKAVVDGLIAKDILSVREEPPGSPLSANASEISEHELKLRQYSLQERQLQFEAAKLRAESESRVVQEKEIDKEIQLMKLKVQLDLKKLETVLSGKAQAVYSALSIQQSSDYNAVKTAILHAYELVPEAYRQKFRSLKKTDKLTFVEFAREKEKIFDRWCNAVNAQTKDSLREMILLEEFKNCIPDTVAMYLNDQKVTTLEHAAVCSDEFSYRNDKPGKSPPPTPTRQSGFETGGCFYCHEVGHRISDCQSLKKKNAKETQKQKLSKGSGFVRPLCQPHSKIDPVYKPFVSSGIVSLTGHEQDSVPVKILRDTGSAQSFRLASTLPFSEESYCGSDVLVQGIEMGFLKVPLHTVHVKSDLISGFVKVAVCSQLPMNSIHFLVGNELAHEKVVPLPEVISKPSEHTDVDSSLAEVFPLLEVKHASHVLLTCVIHLCHLRILLCLLPIQRVGPLSTADESCFGVNRGKIQLWLSVVLMLQEREK